MSKIIQELESCLKYTFTDTTLLRQAMTHSSYAHEYLDDKSRCNERLEFLGDAVLELVTSRMLYTTLSVPEGDLSKRRAQIVCENSLAYAAKALGLGTYLYMSRGEEKNGGRKRNSILADFFEAIIGAIYLDAGYDAAAAFIERELFSRLDEIEEHGQKDFKSLYQEILQGKGIGTPTYETVSQDGPPHKRVFTVEVRLGERVLGEGHGTSKKEAEQMAAKNAYQKYKTGGIEWN